ncbi:unnamed protein product [Bursaphelenchus okinawaensis]|uniref:Uncharacterized protein n=1 Tax=Bursaphelenchus okinawaensis TaxID=465554 RepID=A0A811KVP7_9BILA|nr:unnamed protein product [Bursaphelenchus okinawaensis]CAG9112722.1 unnamed protein product [Bursaphelenchus okinawaensis]
MDYDWATAQTEAKIENENLGAKFKRLIEKGTKTELPEQIIREQEEWNTVFPDLTVTGQSVKLPKNNNSEKNQLINILVTRLVQQHIVPEMKRIVERSNQQTRITKPQPPKSFSLPKI